MRLRGKNNYVHKEALGSDLRLKEYRFIATECFAVNDQVMEV